MAADSIPKSVEATQEKGREKDSQLLIRINSAERDEFISLCEELDTSAAREVRKFTQLRANP